MRVRTTRDTVVFPSPNVKFARLLGLMLDCCTAALLPQTTSEPSFIPFTNGLCTGCYLTAPTHFIENSSHAIAARGHVTETPPDIPPLPHLPLNHAHNQVRFRSAVTQTASAAVE
ncbi:hypothetical protein HDK77DRAFT_127602 [Phyllosticta capitalensis]|uniref:uncharacterized protein n=1 Tax=Phyllosticta capitalensis TaxID=121624 RepID=UPI0031324270